MAIRSGGGTGVLVALVVFVLTTVFLLVMTIVFFAGKNEAEDRANTAQAELDSFINRAQQQADDAKQVRAAAATERQSVYGFLMGQRAETAAWISGNRSADLAAMQGDLGIPKDQTVKGVVTDLRRQLRAKTDEVTSLNGRIGDLNRQLAAARDSLEAARTDSEQQVAAVRGEIEQYSQAADELKRQVNEARTSIARTKDEREGRHRSRVGELQSEIDDLRAERSVLDSRLLALEAKVRAIELKPANPAELVDGRIIAVEGAGEQVFIDIGRIDRVVPGMTFEVFDDANAIQTSDRGGQGRGKSTIQVLRVGEATSTAKVIRQSPGRPVVKEDVIANAVFNPNYRFKFLVHGKFDVDGDGRPSDAESDFIRSRIVEWGGEVVAGDQLTGDLDFLVLGMQPPIPVGLPFDATEAQIQSNLEARLARDNYDRLFKQASDARIPVLNWHRFQTLTGGMTGR